MKTRVLAAAVGAIFVLTGCSNSDSEGVKSDEPKASEQTPKADATDAPKDDTKDDAKADAKDAGADEADQEATYCAELKTSIDKVLGPKGSDKLQVVVAEYTKLIAVAPGEVADNWRTLEKAYGDLLKEFDKIGVDINDPQASRKAVDGGRVDKKIVEATESKDMQDAVKGITDHTTKKCGFDMSGKKV